MIAYLEKALNVRRNEFTPASLLFLYLFLIIGCYIMGIAVGDAMFLNVYPNHLPHVIIATALVVGVFTSVYIRLSHRLRLELMIIGSLVFFSLSFATLWWLTRFQGKWVYPLVYIWVYLTGAIGPTMGWTMANCVLTTREARRVFGFIGAGQVLGAPVAGLATADLVSHGHARPETMLLVIAILLGSCALLVKLLFRQTRERLARLGPGSGSEQKRPKNIVQIWEYIYTSRYLLLITALIAVGCASTTVLGYQFKIIAKTSFGADKAALAAFFARFNGYMGLAAFIVQMLFTGRLLRSVGIRVTLFVLPVVFLGGSMIVLITPLLLAASILKGSHLLLRFSLDKSSTELLYLPVAPPDIKNQIKSFIDGFVWRTADGVGGLALLLFANKLKFSAGRISLVNFVFLLTWIGIAYGVRREYLTVLRQAIDRRTLDPERTAAGILDSTTKEVLARALERSGEQQVLYGLSLFEIGCEAACHPALRGLLTHPSPAVRQRAVRLLGDAGDREILPQVEKMLGDESLEVRTEALHYLVVHSGRDPLNLLSAETDFPDYSVQGSVVAYLVRTGDREYFPAAQLIFQSMLSRAGPEGVRPRAEAARVLGVIAPPCELHSHLAKLLRDEELAVREQALLAAGKIQGREFLALVIELLGQPRLLAAARLALVQYGERSTGTLQDYLNDPAVPLAVRKQIPEVLVRICTAPAAAVLANSLIQSDPGLRFDVLKALNKLRRRNPELLPAGLDITDMLNAELMGYYRSFQTLAALDPHAGTSLAASAVGESMLTRALRERMNHELERIFRLLALLYPSRDIHNAFIGLTSGRPRLQANSLEVLEHLLRPEIYRMLAHALDPEIPLREKLKFADQLSRASVNSKNDALRILLHSEDRWLRVCALYAIGKLRLVELYGDVKRVSHGGDPLLAETWNWASARLAAGTTA